MGQTTFSLAGATWLNENSPNTNYSTATYVKNPAVFKFTSSFNLKYKRVTKAVLNLKGHRSVVGLPSSGISYNTAIGIAPYTTTADISTITFNNYASSGNVGEVIEYTTGAFEIPTGSYDSQITYDPIDITSIFVNNVSNNSFGFYTPYKNNGTEFIREASITVTYEDSVQPAPTPTYPVETYLRENEAVTFMWSWNSATGATQKSVELSYKLKTASAWTVVALTQTSYSYKIAAGLAQGEYVWKIKGTNEVDETSVYSSEVTFNVVGKPSVPVIQTPDNKTLTQINWNATNQAAYELKITDSNGSEIIHESIASAETYYKPHLFLMGNYTVGVAYCNTSGYWSDMAYKTFTINPTSPTKPSASAEIAGNNVKIKFNNSNDVNLAIMRADNNRAYNIIAVIEDDSTEYIDKTVIPGVTYTYVVRSYASGYADSDIMPVVIKWNGAVLNNATNEIHLKLSTDKYSAYTKRVQRDVVLTNYSGRDYAVAERGEYKNDIIGIKFYVTDEQIAELEQIMDSECYYRDEHLNAFKCCITEMNFSGYMNDGYEITLQISRVAESEVVINV